MGGPSPAEHGRRPIGVVAVTHNSEAVLPGFFDSLDQGLAGVDWSLVVVDNDSDDRTPELADGFGRDAQAVRVVRAASNRGFGAGVNLGLTELPPSADLLVVNPDVRLRAGAAARLQSRLGEPTVAGPPDAGEPLRIGVAAPRLVDADGALVASLRFEPSVPRALAETVIGVDRAGRRGWGETILDPAAYARPTVADWASGAALMISRECVAAVRALGRRTSSSTPRTPSSRFAPAIAGFATCLARMPTRSTSAARRGPTRRCGRCWCVNKVDLYRRRHGRGRALRVPVARCCARLRFAATGNRAEPRRGARAARRGSGRR